MSLQASFLVIFGCWYPTWAQLLDQRFPTWGTCTRGPWGTFAYPKGYI